MLELVYDKAQQRERPRRGAPGGAAVQSGKMLTRLRTFFRWALANNLITTDPTIGVRRPAKEASRDRVLSKAEIRAFWAGCGQLGYPFGAIFSLLLLTAQREAEVAGMRWPEVDLENRVWTIPRERAKSNRAHIVHLSALAAEILAGLPRLGELVFPTRTGRPISSFSRAKERLDALMSVDLRDTQPAWVLHDLRRSAATIMAEELKAPPHVVDKILNHSSGTIRGVAAIYNRAAYLDERQAVLEAWGQYVATLIRPSPPRNVVPLRAEA